MALCAERSDGMEVNMDNQENISDEYQPISMWGYLGYEILFAIPLVGFILLLVFSFGGTKNVNLRNFARSYILIAVIVVLLSIIMIDSGISVFNSAL